MNKLLILLTCLFLIGPALAVDWSPQGNITLKNRYYIKNWPVANCTGTDVVHGIFANGTWNCQAPSAEIGDIEGINTLGDYLLGGCASGTCNLTVNETYLNSTINAEDDDTTYTAGTGISLAGTIFSANLTYLNTQYLQLADSFGGEVTGTYDNIVLGHDALDDQYIELGDNFGGDVSGTYSAIIVADDSHNHSCENITGASSNLCTITDTDTQLTEEQVEDFVGGMLGGTETHISVTYQDASNDIDFVVSDDWWDANADISSDEISESKIDFDTSCGAGNHLFISGDNLDCEADDDTTYSAGDYLTLVGTTFAVNETELNATINAEDDDTQLSDEQVQDKAGAMWSGNTETRATVTYQDGDGTIDIVVDDMNDDDPEAGDVHWTDLTDDGTFTDTKYCTYDSGNSRIDCDSGAGTYYNGTGLNLNGSNYFSILLAYALPQSCNDGEIAEYNTTSGGWDCAVDNSAASGMASWVLAALGVGGSEAITDGEIVTLGSGNSYLDMSRSTNNINYTLNETVLNATIDDRDSDTTYTAGDAITLDGTEFDFDGGASPAGELGGTWASPTVDSGIHDDEYIELGDSFGGEVSGTYDNIVLDHDALDDQYYDSEGDLTALLDDNYEGQLDNEAGLYAALSDVSLFLEDLIDDTTPQLGGNLDANGNDIEVDADNKVCLNGNTCTKYIYYNGSNVIIQG